MRVDSGVVEGSVISDLYDPMIAKLVVLGTDRDHARRRMLRALSEFEVEGVHSLIPIHEAILEHPEFAAGGTLREFVEGGGYARSAEPAGAELNGAPARAPSGEAQHGAGRGRRPPVRRHGRRARASRHARVCGPAGRRWPSGRRASRGRWMSSAARCRARCSR